MPAEAKGVAHSGPDRNLARDVRNVVQVTVRIGVLVVDGGRHDSVLESAHAGYRLDSAPGTQHVAGHRLGGRDRNREGALGEDGLDGGGLRPVVRRRARAVGIDVVDVIGLQSCVPKRELHALRSPAPTGSRQRDVGRVVGGGVAHELRADLCPAGLRVFQCLEHEDSGTVTHHEAIRVEGPRGLLRLVIAPGRERLHGRERRNRDLADPRLRPAGDHHVRVAPADDVERVPNGVVAARAGAHRRVIRASRVGVDGDVARRHVGDHRRHQEGADAFDPELVGLDDVPNHGVDAPDAGADDRPGSLGELLVLDGVRETGIGERLGGGCPGVVDVPIVAADLLLGHDRLGVEVAHLSSDLGVDARGIEQRDAPDAAATSLHALPRRSRVVAERRDGTDAGHHHPPLAPLEVAARRGGISHRSRCPVLPALQQSTGRAG